MVWRSRRNPLRKILAFALATTVCLPAAASSPPVDRWHVGSPARIVTQEIRFVSRGATLVGTLSMPASGSRLPAVVVTHAAEAPTRDFALYRHLQSDLPALGYAVFVYDRRGSGASGGDLDESDYELLADDAVAAQKAVAAVGRVDRSRIGFWGLSQGGWLAVLAASRGKQAAFVVSISAPLETPADQMGYAVSNILATKGFSDADIRDAVATRQAVEDYLRSRRSTESAQAALNSAKDKPWFPDIFMDSTVSGHPERSRWRKEMDYDPVAPLLSLRIPVLMLFGSDDPWVPVQASLTRFEQIRRGRPNVAVAVIPGADHMMMPPPKANPMAYDPASLKRDGPEVPRYFLVLANWLANATARATR